MMRQFIVLLLSVFVFTGSLLAQTEIWRAQAGFRFAANGMQNDLYFGYGTAISRVSTDGTTLWQVPSLVTQRKCIVSNQGVFVISEIINSIVGYLDTLAYFDSNGNMLWIKAVNGRFVNESSITPDGDLLTIFASQDRSIRKDTLYRISPNGNIVFAVALPSLSEKYFGPQMDGTGKIWLFNTLSDEHEKTVKGVHTFQREVTLYGYILDGSTGTLLKQNAVIKNHITDLYKDDATGIVKEYHNQYTDNLSFKLWNGTAILKTVPNPQTNSWDKKRVKEYTESTSWEWYSITSDLKSKKFTYMGSGKFIYKAIEGTRNGKAVFNIGSYIHDIKINSTGIAYLTGSSANGTTVDDVGKYHQDIFVIKFNIVKNKIEWKKIINNRPDGVTEVSGLSSQLTENNKLVIFEEYKNKAIVIDLSNHKNISDITLPYMIDQQASYPPVIADNNQTLYSTCYELNYDRFFAKFSLAGLLTGSTNTTISINEPNEFSLSQNYPNPFNPATTISYSIPVDGMVTLTIFNTLGQEVATLVNEMQDAGFKTVTWNASNMPSGIYYYTLNAGTFTNTKKVLLMK